MWEWRDIPQTFAAKIRQCGAWSVLQSALVQLLASRRHFRGCTAPIVQQHWMYVNAHSAVSARLRQSASYWPNSTLASYVYPARLVNACTNVCTHTNARGIASLHPVSERPPTEGSRCRSADPTNVVFPGLVNPFFLYLAREIHKGTVQTDRSTCAAHATLYKVYFLVLSVFLITKVICKLNVPITNLHSRVIDFIFHLKMAYRGLYLKSSTIFAFPFLVVYYNSNTNY